MSELLQVVSENAAVRILEGMLPMPDGVCLYTRAVLPAKAEKCPIIFLRNPYERVDDPFARSADTYWNDPAIRAGYAIVTQHCRGTGRSEGICIPYTNEREDGLATFPWLRRFPFYNGEIFLKGGSYLSTVHLSYLNALPPDVKGAALDIQTDRMFFRNYRNGCNYKLSNIDWFLSMMKRQYPNASSKGKLYRPYADVMKRIVGEDVPSYTQRLLHDTCDEVWTSDPRNDSVDHLAIPVLFTEGWYDFYLEGMFSMWERLPEETKKKSAFVVGPWGHATSLQGGAGYMLPGGTMPADYAVEWFESIRIGKPYRYARTGSVNYYSIAGDCWKADAWPRKPDGEQTFWFAPDGSLGDAPCTDDSACASYRYDPENVPDCFPFHVITEAFPVGSVDGVLSFVSAPAEKDTDFYGETRWRMTVSSDCEDTAFFIRLYFVEEGKAYNLTETITSIAHICPDYVPGEPLHIDLNLPPIGFTLRRGCCLRADISSYGGVYMPNANVRGHWAKITQTRVAHNTIYFRDASVTLPVRD